MRLVVRRSGADGEEGPLAIEIACLRPAVVPVGPHPVLGATFETVDITELEPLAAFGERPAANGMPESIAGDESYFLDPDALDLEDQERS